MCVCVCVCVRACRLTSRMSNSQEFKLRSETLSESAVSDMVCDLQILVSRFQMCFCWPYKRNLETCNGSY